VGGGASKHPKSNQELRKNYGYGSFKDKFAMIGPNISHINRAKVPFSAPNATMSRHQENHIQSKYQQLENTT